MSEGTIAAMAMSAAQGDIIKELRAEIERLRAALTHFADPANWHEAPGCQQWMGKLDARSFANSVLNHLPRDDE